MQTLESPPRLVVVGYGRWGKHFHCGLVRTTPGLTLHGVVARRAELRREIENGEGCLVYPSLDDALRDPAADVILLATPNSTHAELAVQALEAGKHVVTDKVMCLSLAECDRMIEAAQRCDRLLTVVQNRRCDGDFRTVRELIESGRLGDVRWIEMNWQGFGPWGRWRGQSAMGGGRIYDLGPHLLDQLLLLFPEPVESVYCRVHHDFPEVDIESEGLIVVAFASGRSGIIDVSALATIEKPRFRIRGTGGTFVKFGLDPQEKAMMDGNIDAAVESPALYGTLKTTETETVIPTSPGRWRDYFENLRDVLVHGAEPLVKLEECRRTMAVIDAAKQSAATGKVIRLA